MLQYYQCHRVKFAEITPNFENPRPPTPLADGLRSFFLGWGNETPFGAPETQYDNSKLLAANAKIMVDGNFLPIHTRIVNYMVKPIPSNEDCTSYYYFSSTWGKDNNLNFSWGIGAWTSNAIFNLETIEVNSSDIKDEEHLNFLNKVSRLVEFDIAPFYFDAANTFIHRETAAFWSWIRLRVPGQGTDLHPVYNYYLVFDDEHKGANGQLLDIIGALEEFNKGYHNRLSYDPFVYYGDGEKFAQLIQDTYEAFSNG
jgi:hypothetical protein